MLFCDAAVEEVVIEPPLGDVVANVEVGGKMPEGSKMLDVQDVNADLRAVDVHLDVPLFVEVLLGNDAEVAVTILM